MSWQRNPALTANGYFRCKVKYTQWHRAFRKARSEQGLCIHCGDAELATKTMCQPCADSHAEIMARPKQVLDHHLAQIRHRQRERAKEGFEPTGIGTVLAAMTRKDKNGQV